MLNRFVWLTISLMAALTFSSLGFARKAPPQHSGTAKNQTEDQTAARAPAPAPRLDISGTWEPANGPNDGVQANGVKSMPSDGKPEHQLPFTPYGLEVFKSHKALEGVDAVLPAFFNDPRDKCEPLGFPRTNFYNLRETQIMQNEYKVAILYEYGETWRVIWTDGRELPRAVEGGVLVGKDFHEQRYYGYSVGRWVDDTTLVVQTVGMMPEDKVWLDTAGRPVSDALRVEERLHRVNHDRLEWTVTIDDPKMYTEPWVAMDKIPHEVGRPSYGCYGDVLLTDGNGKI